MLILQLFTNTHLQMPLVQSMFLKLLLFLSIIVENTIKYYAVIKKKKNMKSRKPVIFMAMMYL